MVIMLDANALVENTRFDNATWRQLSKAIELGTARVVVPRIAVREAQKRYERMREKTALEVQQKAQSAPTVGHELIMRGVEAVKQEGRAYEPGPLLVERGAVILATPEVDHDTLAERAVSRVRPFNEKGDGYRDTLHWYSLLALMRERPGDGYVLVTNDDAFYEDTKGEGRLLPHPSIMGEAAQALGLGVGSPELARRARFLRLLGELEVPHQYEGEPYKPDYGRDFALLAMTQEATVGGALDLSEKAFGWRGWDFSEPHVVQAADVLTAEARRLSSSTDVEVRFELMGDVTYKLTRYGKDRGDSFPEVVNEHRTATVVMTGRAIVPATGVEHLSLNSVEARPFRLNSGTGSSWATFDSQAAWKLINKQLWGEILASTQASAKIAEGALPASMHAAVTEAMQSPLPRGFDASAVLRQAQEDIAAQIRAATSSPYRDAVAEAADKFEETPESGDEAGPPADEGDGAAASGPPTDTADDPDFSDDDATDAPEDDSSRE